MRSLLKRQSLMQMPKLVMLIGMINPSLDSFPLYPLIFIDVIACNADVIEALGRRSV
jgi:hypothetical protein